jgi:2-oxoglutarate dehydrogenase E2 component (dihydrolipoamide succinyltransferase)
VGHEEAKGNGMAGEIVVPTLGESVSEATIAKWLKSPGEAVAADEPVVEIETDKVSLEIGAPVAGVVKEIRVKVGETVAVGAVLGSVEAGAAPTKAATPAPAPAPIPAAAKAAPPPVSAKPASDSVTLSPAVRKLIEENKLDPAAIAGTGKGGRLTKEDVIGHLEKAASEPLAPSEARVPPPSAPIPATPAAEAPREQRVRMSRLRKRIAERLKQAQTTAAILTTFNEVDMSKVIALRASARETFERRHGVKLGFMSFFVKAAVIALKEIPSVNGEIDGEEIIYKNHYDIGVAVGTEQGLVVPVVRDADRLSFAEIEKKIGDFGQRARDGKLTLDELSGGTFTISNGGVYGSLMSTPILNPPQSGILGMHKTQNRPVAVGDRIEIRPMMYLALSYDHRIIDGREAVTFLVRVKECIEDPGLLLLDA